MAQEIEDFKFVISDEARPYLEIQKGNLWKYRENREEWESAYNRSINNAFRTIEPFLPEKCESVLDVGSGLGGINILIDQKFPGTKITLLDGWDDAPIVKTHNQTFNDMGVAGRFMKVNGIDLDDFDGVSPKSLNVIKDKFDLVLSFGAWCFHFPPSEYLSFVNDHIKPGTVIILQVRQNKPQWLEELENGWGKSELIKSSRKFDTRVWKIVA